MNFDLAYKKVFIPYSNFLIVGYKTLCHHSDTYKLHSLQISPLWRKPTHSVTMYIAVRLSLDLYEPNMIAVLE